MSDAPLIAEGLAGSLLKRALRNGGDFADLYVERRSTFSLALDDRRVERAQSGLETGASVRVVAGDSTYFAHVDGLAESDLERLADEVSAAVRLETTAARPLRALVVGAPQAIETPPQSVPADRKAQLLRECDERARAAGDAVTQVSAAYNEARREVQVANSDGLLAADDRTRVRLGAQVVARREDRVESGMESLAGHRRIRALRLRSRRGSRTRQRAAR